jgi:hypothetical protein
MSARAWALAFIVSLALLGVLLLAYVITGTAHAMGMCGKRVDFVRALNDKYQESGKALAIAGQVNLVEVFTSKAGTWTILVTTPEGKTCIMAAGNSWEDMPPEILGEGL